MRKIDFGVKQKKEKRKIVIGLECEGLRKNGEMGRETDMSCRRLEMTDYQNCSRAEKWLLFVDI